MKGKAIDSGDATEAAATVSLDMCKRPFNLPQFLNFKTALKADLHKSLKDFMSPAKGKSYAQFLADMLDKDSNLREDPEVVKMEIPKLVAKAEDLQKNVREMVEKRVTMWRFGVCRDDGWLPLVEEVFEKKACFNEVTEECKQVVQIVREVKEGIKRLHTQARRAVNYKHGKLIKSLVAGGYEELLAKCMTKSYFAAAFWGGGAQSDDLVPKLALAPGELSG